MNKIKYLTSNSIIITKVFIILFGIVITALALSSPFVVEYFKEVFHLQPSTFEAILLYSCIYIGCISGYYMLYNLYSLLQEIEKGNIFTEANIKHLNRVSLSCSLVSITCLSSCLSFISLLFIGVAAGFVALICRIVMQVFIKALSMKSELDFTV